MWAGVVIVLLGGVASCRGSAYSAYQYYAPETDYDDGTDFYDSYDEDTASIPTISTTEVDSHTRIKRYGEPDELRTLNPQEVRDVKGALRDILYGHKLTTRKGFEIKDYTDIYDYVDKSFRGHRNVSDEELEGVLQKWVPNVPTRVNNPPNTAGDGANWSPRMAIPWSAIDESNAPEDAVKVIQAGASLTSIREEDVRHWVTAREPEATSTTTETSPTTDSNIKESDIQRWITLNNVPSRSSPLIRPNATEGGENAQDDQDVSTTTEEDDPHWFTLGETSNSTTADINVTAGVQRWSPLGTNMQSKPHLIRAGSSTTSTKATKKTTKTTTTTTTTRPTTTSSPKMDINAIIAIIANLTYDYDWNLTEQFNKSLIVHGVPTCPTESTPTTTSTTPSVYDFSNSSVVGKCFVCGLKNMAIPREAFCADAFAGDFLPLTPVDPRARGQIASFRKYCRYLDVHNYVENPSEPRSIYGRFTGGCGVRWTDLSGIYTQRTCRNRFKPLMGRHYASKRMAKLELALVTVDNGCIISPMATLLPLSRGISLYARFHACVCTGSWCNTAVNIQQWKPYMAILWFWLTTRI